MSPSRSSDRATAVVVGAGHAGLAASHSLTGLGIDHVVLERGEVANSWRTERWDSLRLLTPNWLSRLPGHHYAGPDPDGYMTAAEVAGFIDAYATRIAAPVRTGTTVASVRRADDGYRVTTDRGEIACRAVVLAGGACNRPAVPALAGGVPASVTQVTPFDYRGRTGCPTAACSWSAGRRPGCSSPRRSGGRAGRSCCPPGSTSACRGSTGVATCSGGWTPRACGTSATTRSPTSPGRGGWPPPARRVAGPFHLGPQRADRGGRRGGRAGGGGARRRGAVLRRPAQRRLPRRPEAGAPAGLVRRLGPGGGRRRQAARAVRADARAPSTRLRLDLRGGEVRTVVWATGFRPDYSWLDVPVVDGKGHLVHDGGVLDSPGLYALGLPVLRRRKSTFLHGIEDDAREVIAHLAGYLARG
ncbi:NAD(P)-binding domain-containing protein [Actinokineospora soli]|uniref:NAD(P)-binding domain-containing protein n=1 Tax=Actinokineospora soli TaxID=1048753 RepID=A0ABW2TRR2_9PSEU